MAPCEVMSQNMPGEIEKNQRASGKVLDFWAKNQTRTY
jgi:hypothetical protein